MSTHLKLVEPSDQDRVRHAKAALRADEPSTLKQRFQERRLASQFRRAGYSFQDAERGAVTAEYAILITAGVAFAGLLVAIMRSGAIRSALTDLVKNALTSGG